MDNIYYISSANVVGMNDSVVRASAQPIEDPNSNPCIPFFSEVQLFVMAKSYTRTIASNNLENFSASV